jgi:hypothetical protein
LDELSLGVLKDAFLTNGGRSRVWIRISDFQTLVKVFYAFSPASAFKAPGGLKVATNYLFLRVSVDGKVLVELSKEEIVQYLGATRLQAAKIEAEAKALLALLPAEPAHAEPRSQVPAGNYSRKRASRPFLITYVVLLAILVRELRQQLSCPSLHFFDY